MGRKRVYASRAEAKRARYWAAKGLPVPDYERTGKPGAPIRVHTEEAAVERVRVAALRAGAPRLRAANGSAEAAENDKRRRHDLCVSQREERKAFIAAWKAEHPCVDCGFADPRALDFDHRDRATKSFNIAEAVKLRHLSLDKLKAEIAKCDVRCANCHRIKSAEQEDWKEVEDWERYAAAGAENTGV